MDDFFNSIAQLIIENDAETEKYNFLGFFTLKTKIK